MVSDKLKIAFRGRPYDHREWHQGTLPGDQPNNTGRQAYFPVGAVAETFQDNNAAFYEALNNEFLLSMNQAANDDDSPVTSDLIQFAKTKLWFLSGALVLASTGYVFLLAAT